MSLPGAVRRPFPHLSLAGGGGGGGGGPATAFARRWLDRAALAAFALLLASMYGLQWRPLSDAVALAVVAVAALAALGGAAATPPLRGIAAWLGAAAGLLLAAALLSPEVELAEAARAIRNCALIAAFLLFCGAVFGALGRQHGQVGGLLTMSGGVEAAMALLFAAGALSAAVSVAAHLGAGHGLEVRLALLGRARNPIPAAGAIAAAGLAGLALLRHAAGPPPGGARRWLGAAGLAAILLAMLLTQSRGPLIGLVLGAAVLLLPAGRAARAGWAVPLAVFLLASAVVPLEAVVRDLVCADDRLYCRPSLRLPLWRQAMELIAGHPLAGLGIGHPLGGGWLNNPQNAVLATATYFGIPFLLLACLGLWLLLRRLAAAMAAAAPGDPGLRWAQAMMVFSAAYFAFEPSPFAFYNAHYLFFWMPAAVILLSGAGPPQAQDARRGGGGA